MEKAEFEKRKRHLFLGGAIVTALCVSSGVFVILQKIPQFAATRSEMSRASEREVQSAAANAALQIATERISSEERKAKQEEKLAQERKAAQATADEHAKFIERHLNTGFDRKAGVKSVALVVSCDGKMNHGLDSALLDRFKGESVQMLPSFFTSEFVSDGLFDGAFTGSKEVFTKLDLAKYVGSLVLAREQIEYAKNPDLENVITATIQLEVTSLSVQGNALAQTWSFVANGAGFRQAEARALAEERLAKQIAKDTKMSLPP